MDRYNIQVPKEMYFEGYDDLDRFTSYYYQLEAVKSLSPSSVLEVGVGNKTVTNYLKQHGYQIHTVDHDEELEPDYVADIRSIPVQNESYDVVLASEVLEHIEYDEVHKALTELKRIAKKYVIISLPYSCANLTTIFNIRLPRISKRWNVSLRLPYFLMKTRMSGRNKEHCWEVGKLECSKRKIRSMFKKYFVIEKEYCGALDTYHRYYILKKV